MPDFEGFNRIGKSEKSKATKRDAQVAGEIYQSRAVGPEAMVVNSTVTHILFEIDNTSQKNLGFTPTEMREWTQALTNGRIPSGFSDLGAFEREVISRADSHAKGRHGKYSPEKRKHHLE